jgi:hypothetical protein
LIELKIISAMTVRRRAFGGFLPALAHGLRELARQQ